MPSYNFECQECNFITTFRFSSVSLFLSSQNNLRCEKCSSAELERSLTQLTSSIQRDKETILQQVMEDKNRIVEKIRQGDAKTIRNIYGEEK